MTGTRCRCLAFTAGTFLAIAAHGLPPAAQVVSLEPYEVWCTDVSVPDGADEARYHQLLAEGVGVMDKALGTGGSTGTPFAARSRRREDSVTANGEKRVDVFSVVTVCARVSPKDPPLGGVFRETRSETVFAQSCPIADRDACIVRLRTLLAQRLGIQPEDNQVQQLFWRAASSGQEPAGTAALAAVLLATDKRRVHVAPQVNVIGSAAAAAELSKPIEQQVARPLLQAHPSWFNVIVQPEDAWLVVAITRLLQNLGGSSRCFL